MNHTTVAVDLAKNVFEIGVSHEPGKVSEQKRVNRAKLVSFFAKRPEATVLLEACGSSHYWARKIRSFGHTRGSSTTAPGETLPAREQNRPRRHERVARGLSK